jgi:hypothetical protein
MKDMISFLSIMVIGATLVVSIYQWGYYKGLNESDRVVVDMMKKATVRLK